MDRNPKKASPWNTISLVFLALSLLFCSEPEPMDELVFGFPSDPASLDPLYATDLVSQKINPFLHRTLYRWKSQILVQDLVKNQTISKSGLETIWKLQLDGDYAEDIAFTLDRMKKDNWPRKKEYDFFVGWAIESSDTILIKTKSISEFEFKEKFTYPFTSILSKNSTPNNWIGHGPYLVKEWKKNEFLLLELSSLDSDLPRQIRIRVLPQSTTSLYLYKKGRLDLFKLSDFQLAQESWNLNNLITKRGRSVQYIAINNKNPCFDLNFRKALNYAIPKEKIRNTVLRGFADSVYGPVPSDSKEPYPYDLNLAQKYLEQSRCYPDLKTKILELRMRGDDENQAKGKVLVTYLTQLGLNTKLRGMEKAPLYKENSQGLGDLTLLTWYSDSESLWNFLDPLFHSKKFGNGGNRSFYENQKITSLLDSQDKPFTPPKEVLEEITRDAPWIFLWSIPETFLVSDRFLRFSKLRKLF